METKILTLDGTPEVAREFGVTPQRVRQLIDAGVLVPDVRIGRVAGFDPERVQRLARERRRARSESCPTKN
jgi:DNA-binding transcriptional MerR regulator